MLFGKKKKKPEGLPDLPAPNYNPNFKPVSTLDLPPNPALDTQSTREPQDHSSLPSFPDSPTHQGFSQTAIKDAVSQHEPATMEIDDHENHNESPHPSLTTEKPIESSDLEEWKPKPIGMPAPSESHPATLPEIPKIQETALETPAPIPNARSGIFVKINKFQLARKSLDQAQFQLEEIQDILKQIKSVRLQEESELQEWEKELTAIKNKVKDVTEDIFENVEWVQNS